MKALSILKPLFIAVTILFALNAQAAQTSPVEIKKIAATASVENDPVDINTADVDALQSLKGVGEKKAQAIIEYREQHGNFKTVEDLANVKGFNEKTVASIMKNNPGRLVLKAKA